MRLSKGLLLCMIIGSCIISCDPYGGYEYWINNLSDSSIYVVYSYRYNDTIISQEVKSNQNMKFLHFETHGGLYDEGIQDLYSLCDSFAIFTDTINKRLIGKDYSKRVEWTYMQDKIGCSDRSGDNIYTFTIQNKDLK